MYYALDSWSNSYQAIINLQKIHTIKIKIGKKFKIVFTPKYITPKYKSNYDTPVTEYKLYRFKYKIEFWKSTSNESWTTFTPYFILIKWKLQFFNRSYNKMQKTDDLYDATNCLEYIVKGSKNDIVRKDKTPARIASFLIRFFYYKKVKAVRNIIDSKTNQTNSN
jgi:hypothetical protein